MQLSFGSGAVWGERTDVTGSGIGPRQFGVLQDIHIDFDWTDLAPAEQPALFMSEKGGHAATKTLGVPIVWTLYADFYVYVHSSDPYLAPARLLNPLLDAIEAALAPSPAARVQSLGLPAMVQHAYIAGKVETDEGVLGDQAIAIVPIEILCV